LQLLYAAGHEVGLVLFGTKDTSNYLNDKMGKHQYENVTTNRQLDKIDLEFLRSIDDITAEDKSSARGDIFDSLIVGMEMLMRHTGVKK
jgi:ATP-dependent DNA helicase 2 subunit 2